MEILVSLKRKDMYKRISSMIDGVVLGTKYSFYCDHAFNESEIDEVINECQKDNKKVFLLVNLVMHEEYKNEVREFVKKFVNDNVYYIFQDLGVLNILLSLNLEKRGIYNPITMITNYEDLLMYEALGIDGIGVSNEIPLDDVKKCVEKSKNVFYLGFGYHPIYQTYRKLASLYKEYSKLGFSLDGLSIKELNKEDRLPIIENEYGSIVFRSGVISILEYIDKVEKLKYLLLDGIFIDEDMYLKVITIYYNVIMKKITNIEGMALLNELNLKYSNNFINEDSVYNPEDF